MKKYIFILVAACGMLACNKDNRAEKRLQGLWNIATWTQTKNSATQANVNCGSISFSGTQGSLKYYPNETDPEVLEAFTFTVAGRGKNLTVIYDWGVVNYRIYWHGRDHVSINAIYQDTGLQMVEESFDLVTP